MPLKDIAVPSRSAGKKRGSEAPREPRQLHVPAVPTGERTVSVSHVHRFSVGQRLAMASGGREISRGASACYVVFLLPHDSGPLRYRVRSDNESFERIVDEADLAPLPPGLD